MENNNAKEKQHKGEWFRRIPLRMINNTTNQWQHQQHDKLTPPLTTQWTYNNISNATNYHQH